MNLRKGGALHQDALHRNAGLAGVGEASGHATVGGISQVGVAMNDHARIAAEFEHNFFLPGMSS